MRRVFSSQTEAAEGAVFRDLEDPDRSCFDLPPLESLSPPGCFLFPVKDNRFAAVPHVFVADETIDPFDYRDYEAVTTNLSSGFDEDFVNMWKAFQEEGFADVYTEDCYCPDEGITRPSLTIGQPRFPQINPLPFFWFPPLHTGSLQQVSTFVSDNFAAVAKCPPVQPDDIPGIIQWLRSKDIIGLADGATISSWPEKVGVPWDQPTASKRPLFKDLPAFRFFRNPGVLFDGIDDFLTAATSVVPSSNWTVVIVYRNTTPASSFPLSKDLYLFDNSDDGDSGLQLYIDANNSPAPFPFTAEAFSSSASIFKVEEQLVTIGASANFEGLKISTFAIHSWDGTTGTGKVELIHASDKHLFFADLQFNSATATGTSAVAETVGFLGSTSKETDHFEGLLAEFIVYNRELTIEEKCFLAEYCRLEHAIS